MDKLSFGKQIRNHRLKLNLTGSQLSQKLKVDSTIISKIENDKSKPKVFLMLQLIEMFELSLEDIKKLRQSLEHD